MYTANVVDSVVFRAIGAPPNPRVTALRQAVGSVDADIWVPATVYRETATGTTPNAGTRTNPFLDQLVSDGVVRIATPLPGTRSDAYETVGSNVERARHRSAVSPRSTSGSGLAVGDTARAVRGDAAWWHVRQQTEHAVEPGVGPTVYSTALAAGR